ncbi:MAG: ATP-binding cassette domain-containing protein [bacterium]
MGTHNGRGSTGTASGAGNPDAGICLLLAVGLTAVYGGNPVLDNVSLGLAQWSTMGITGPGGSGKSTLLRLFAGFGAQATVISGSITRYSGSMYFMPQKPERVPLNLATALSERTGCTEADLERQLRLIWLDQAEIAAELIELLQSDYATLCSDRRKLIDFTLAIAGNEPLLLLDEPDSIYDDMLLAAITRKLHELRGTRTILLVSHNQRTIRNTCTRVVRMLDGVVVDDGDPIDVFSKALDLRISALQEYQGHYLS